MDSDGELLPVDVRMCECMSFCTDGWACLCKKAAVCVSVCARASVWVCARACLSLYMCVCIFVCVCIWVWVWVCACVRACVPQRAACVPLYAQPVFRQPILKSDHAPLLLVLAPGQLVAWGTAHGLTPSPPPLHAKPHSIHTQNYPPTDSPTYMGWMAVCISGRCSGHAPNLRRRLPDLSDDL